MFSTMSIMKLFKGTVSQDFLCLDNWISTFCNGSDSFLVNYLFVKVNCKCFCHPQQIGLEFSQISLNPLTVLFNCFSKAAWELQTGFLKLHGSGATDSFSKAELGTDHRKMTRWIDNVGSCPHFFTDHSTTSVPAHHFLTDHSTMSVQPFIF